jgi:VWFA-related protein
LFSAALLAMILCTPKAVSAQRMPGSGSQSIQGGAGEGKHDVSDDGAYDEGIRAIHGEHWTEAIELLASVASQHGGHADGALYWKAYAEDKQGLPSNALDTCKQLRQDYPWSQWISECGALEIEIRARSGQLDQFDSGDDDLTLLALNELIKKDAAQAIYRIEKILDSDASEDLKKKAVFVLAQSRSIQAQNLLAKIALGLIVPSHPDPVLQEKAAQLFSEMNNRPADPSNLASGRAPATITLDVVVTDKSGTPVSGLQPSDFKVLDNNHVLELDSFTAASGMSPNADPPVEVFIVVDAVNEHFLPRSEQRQWLRDFFNENGKQLALPTSLVILTDNGITEQSEPTRDGAALISAINDSYAGFRQIRGYEGLEGARLREEDSLKALNLFAQQQSRRPGRKLFIWLGEGWGVASNPLSFGGPKKMQNIYTYIASLSTALRKARITLYAVVPVSGVGRDDYYMQYVKGVSDAKHVDLGDLSLPVLATQTGGLVLTGSSDLTALINQCVADARTYYQLSFKPPAATHPNEYHDLAVQIDKPGMVARTRTGYYWQP